MFVRLGVNVKNNARAKSVGLLRVFCCIMLHCTVAILINDNINARVLVTGHPFLSCEKFVAILITNGNA